MNGNHDGYHWCEGRLADMALLGQALHGAIRAGEVTESVARQLYAAVYGITEAEEEFGSDPQVDNIIKGQFG